MDPLLYISQEKKKKMELTKEKYTLTRLCFVYIIIIIPDTTQYLLAMTTNTSSPDILKEYLIKRLEIRDHVSLDAFKKEFPSNVSIELIEKIYKEIERQQQHRFSKIKQNIESQFDIPISNLISEISTNSGTVKKSILLNLTKELELLMSKLATQESELNENIKQKINDLNSLIPLLPSIQFAEEQESDEIMDDVLQKIDTISGILSLNQSINS